jgi:hypothetical protein
MASATVAAGSTRGQTSDDSRPAADDGPTFPNLFEARAAVCHAVGRLDDDLNALEGDLCAIEGLAFGVVENHKDQIGPAAQGLIHCATRALATLRRVRELHERLAEAAQVSEGNDPSRLSAAANRYRPGPHVPTYGPAAGDAP